MHLYFRQVLARKHAFTSTGEGSSEDAVRHKRASGHLQLIARGDERHAGLGQNEHSHHIAARNACCHFRRDNLARSIGAGPAQPARNVDIERIVGIVETRIITGIARLP